METLWRLRCREGVGGEDGSETALAGGRRGGEEEKGEENRGEARKEEAWKEEAGKGFPHAQES